MKKLLAKPMTIGGFLVYNLMANILLYIATKDNPDIKGGIELIKDSFKR